MAKSKRPTPTEAIKAFLLHKTHADIAKLYSYNMEVQVNVAQDNGQKIQKKSGFTGRMWNGYTDGLSTWKPFRIPWNAMSDPNYTEVRGDGKIRTMQYDIAKHAEGIGMTGWDWKNQVSRWVAYDFDSIVGHSTGLNSNELQQLEEVAYAIPWVTVRKSTSGSGLHIYVFLEVETKTHTEHAALARAVLGKMSAETGYDFNSKVDICGGNMWVWHRKMTKQNGGLTLIKQGEPLKDVPANWKDHLVVVRGNRRKNLPQFVGDANQSVFDELTGQRPRVKLDDVHRKLLEYLKKEQAQWWWDADHWMLVCHTADLKAAHEALGFRGIFNTVATGKEAPDHNCFAFPLEHPSGAWTVRRYSIGVQESLNWDQDPSGYTRCFYNREPTLRTAANMFSGVEDEKGCFHFSEAESAATVAQQLGVELKLPPWACVRPTVIKQHKDGRLVVEVKREPNDRPEDMINWREDKGWWKRIFNARIAAPTVLEVGNFDHIVRHIVDAEFNDLGWAIHANNTWRNEPLHHVKMALKTNDMSAKDVELVLGRCVSESWTLVNEPFQEEHPGNRKWNRFGVQFKFKPKQEEPFECPTWDSILNHVGSGLDFAIKEDGWCLANGIQTGGDYLRCWVASLFQEPKEPLPYLFFYSHEENTGKSSLHEALSLLMTKRGFSRADTALTSQQSFNGELENAILCAIQETDLRRSVGARNRLKDWVTTPQLSIHEKGRTPYLVDNTTHYIQTANDPGECPVFPGDSRITMGYVSPIGIMDMIPKRELFRRLKKEAPDFMAVILGIEIPDCNDRLRIPIISTVEKQQSQQLNRSPLEEFLEEQTYEVPGSKILYSTLYERFEKWLDPNDRVEWTKIKMGRALPLNFPKGRLLSDGARFYVGNISFEKPEESDAHNPRFILRGDNLEIEK
jgi:hypothetical protein